MPDLQAGDAVRDSSPRVDLPAKDLAPVADAYPYDARILGDGGLPPDCGTGSPASCPTEQQGVLHPTADTILAAGGTGTPFESINVMNIGLLENGATSRGVLRFDLSTLPGLTSVDKLIELALELSPAEQAQDCGFNQCGPCATLEHDGPFELRAMTNLWTASEVCWVGPTQSSSWKKPAASDPSERGIVLSRAFYRGGSVLRFDFPCGAAMKTELKRWVTGPNFNLALQVVSLGGQIVAASREANSCSGSHLQPVLRVKWCTP